MISEKQIAMLLARMSEAGYETERSKYDWLYENNVNINDYSQLGALSNTRLNELLDKLRK